MFFDKRVKGSEENVQHFYFILGWFVAFIAKHYILCS